MIIPFYQHSHFTDEKTGPGVCALSSFSGVYDSKNLGFYLILSPRLFPVHKEKNNDHDSVECYVQRDAGCAPVFTLRLSLTLKILPALTLGIRAVPKHIKGYQFQGLPLHLLTKQQDQRLSLWEDQEVSEIGFFFFPVHPHSTEIQHAKYH